MDISTIFIDLDDTVYPVDSGLWAAIRNRIDQYMHERVNIPLEQIPQLRPQLYSTYGTTMRGLMALHDIDMYDYLAYVHDVHLADYIAPDARVRESLLHIPQRKVIFTNADVNHARRVLNHLQIADCFEQIIDILAIEPYCKPMLKAFEIALRCANELPGKCAFVDDSAANLATARQMGFFTVQVGNRTVSSDCHARIDNLSALVDILQMKA